VDVQLSKISLNGYESMGFDVRSLTQDRDQEQFTITTQTPIPLSIYDDRYTWVKYGRLILPQVLKLNEVQNNTIRGMYRNFLGDFLRVDLESNITNTLDVSTKSKLNEYLSSLFKGLSETATTEKTSDEYLNTAEKMAQIFERLLEIAVSATTIPLSIFTNLFHQRFLKHDYLESTLEILQQFYIKMHSDHKSYCVIPGDLCQYTLKCVCCDTSITLPGTIGETLYHAPVAIVRHWEIMDHEDHPMNIFDLSHIPVLFFGNGSLWKSSSFVSSNFDKHR